MKLQLPADRGFRQRLHNAARRHGWEVSYGIVLSDDNINFSRLTATPKQLDTSYGGVARLLGASGCAVPRAYKPQEDGNVHLGNGAGYAGDETNPNPSGMGLVKPMEMVGDNIALVTTFADAPAAALVHIPTGLTATVSGIWYLAAYTIRDAMKLLADQIGLSFRPEDVWVILSPGARYGFMLNDKGVGKLTAANRHFEGYVVRDYSPNADKPHSLDLALLFFEEWLRAGVLKAHIFFDERNTLTEKDASGNLALPSARNAAKRGLPGYSSGSLAINVR